MDKPKRKGDIATRILGLVARSLEIILRLAFLLVSVAIVFGVAYFLGHVFFHGLRGNDSFNALNNIHWLDRFFPKIPFWYPLQGGGVSSKWGYPLLSSILPVVMDRIFNLGLVGAFQLLGFLSLPLTALGMYLFVWWRLKSQVGGLIAAVFYLVAPASWIWLFDWGFYAENISYIFFFPTLICFDVFFTAVLKGEGMEWKARVNLFLAAVFGGLLFATHPSPFFSLLMILTISTFIRTAWAVRRLRLDLVLKSLGSVAIFALVTVLLVGFISLNYVYYTKHTASFGLTTELNKENFIYYYTIPFKPFLGLERIPWDDFKFTMRNMVIPPQIWAPAVLALVLAPWVGIEAFALAMAGLISFVLLFKPEIMFWFLQLRIPFIAYIATMRAQVVILKFMIPMAAGMGIVAVGRLLVWLPTFWIKHKWRLLWWLKKGLAWVVVPTFSLVVFIYLLLFFANKPERLWKSYEVRYGPCYFSARDPFFKFSIDICGTPEEMAWEDVEVEGLSTEEVRFFQQVAAACAVREVKEEPIDAEVCQELQQIEQARLEPEEKGKLRTTAYSAFAKRCRQQPITAAEQAYCPLITDDLGEILKWLVANLQEPSYWPKPDLGYKFVFDHLHPVYRDFIRENKDDQWLRVDVSPTLGGVVQGINILSEISIINLYTAQLSLLGPYWGLEQQVLFSENDGRIETVNEIAKYYGTSYILTAPEHDTLQKYENREGGWRSVGVEHGTIWKFDDAPAMYSWSKSKPLILVIGDKEKRAFEPVFRAAIKGAVPYDRGILVEGSERVDDYSLQELSRFDTVFLYGYHYKNQRNAWNLLEQYVKNGGALYISTGWQYVDADWEWEKTAALLPIDSLSWRDEFTKDTKYDYDGSIIGDKKLSKDKLSPLIWADKGWGVSTGQLIKEWAQPVLLADGWPLVVAGEYGEGKVVWSGLNIIGHSHTYDYNQEELRLLRQLVAWLGSPEMDDDLTAFVKPQRDYPDKVEFEFGRDSSRPTVFYWREAEFPEWQARLSSGEKLSIYHAGPGFMAIRLPAVNSGDRLVLEFKPGLRAMVVSGISILISALMIFYLVVGKKLFRPLTKFFAGTTGKWRKEIKKQWSKEEDEDY